MNKKIITLCSALTIATFFAACGDMSNDDTPPKLDNEKQDVEKKADVNIVGRVMDGYIQGATVFFDENKNLTLDATEPKTKTNELGQFTLGLTNEQAKKIDRTHRIISLGDGIDYDTKLPFTTSLASAPTDKMVQSTIYLTPVSTFLTNSAVNAVKGKIDGVNVMQIREQLNQTFGIDVAKQENYIKDNNLAYYKINNILQKAKEVSGISYDDFSKLITKSITLDELLAKLDKPNEVRAIKDFYSKVTQEEVETKKANINKAVMEKINNEKYDFDKISINDLPNDEEIKDVDDIKPTPPKDDEQKDDKDVSGGFTYSDLVGEVFSMHSEDGSIFMGLRRLEFSSDKINDSIPYKIENGLLKLEGMGTFKKTGESGDKIFFEDINTKKRYYFKAKKANDPEDNKLVPQNGVLYSPYNKSATIFVDTNKNLVLDSDEPSAVSDENGNFTIKVKQIFIDKKYAIVAINGKNDKGDVSKNIAFKTMMGEDKIVLNAFSSALTGLAYAITNNMVMQDLSHSNMIPSLTKNIGIDIEDLTSDITKPALVKIALKINSFVGALANTYNDDKAHGTHILEAYMHLFSNVLSDIQPNIPEFGLDKLLERFNEKNKLIKVNPNFEQKYVDIKTFKDLLKAINDEIDGAKDMAKIENYIKEAKKFRPKKRDIAVSWDANMNSADYKLPKDQFSKYQWHLLDQGAVVNTHGIYTVGGNDLKVKPLYEQGIVGQNAWVRVVDDGLEAEHEDLKGRLNVENSWSAEKKSHNTTPKNIADSHGTNVAGLIAADGSNDIGVRGVAPYATLTGYKLRTPQPGALDYNMEELRDAWLGGDDKISIVNNSWGSTADKYIEEENILKEGAETKRVRDGKALGRIYMIASGNGGFNQREVGEDGEILDIVDDSATSYFRGSQYAITVAAVRNENTITQYSTQGSNVLVSGYGGGIKTHTSALMATTTRTGASKTTWPEDSKKAYSFAFDGTSAATPVASGALALVLSECPDLSYRDVKWLIANTATKIDENYDTTTISGVKNVPPFSTTPKLDLYNGFGYVKNAAGLSHSNYYGYGLVNPTGMINMCKDSSFKHLPAKKEIKVTNENTGLIPLNKNNHYLKEKIMVNKSVVNGLDRVEWVGLTIYGKFDNLHKLSIVLISPSGTVSRILTNSKSAIDEVMKVEEGYRLSSVAFVDEDPQGEWTLIAQSDDMSDTGRFTKLKLEIVGYNNEERNK